MLNNNNYRTFRMVNATILTHSYIVSQNKEVVSKVCEITFKYINILVNKYFKKYYNDFTIGIDFLGNPIGEDRVIVKYNEQYRPLLEKVSENYHKGCLLYADSGGLQYYRARHGEIADSPESVLERIKDIYYYQKNCDYGFCFDYIPFYNQYTVDYKDFKIGMEKTVEFLENQLEYMRNENARVRILPIFQMSINPDLFSEWADYISHNIDWNDEYIGGASCVSIWRHFVNTQTPEILLYTIALARHALNKIEENRGNPNNIFHILGILAVKNIELFIYACLSGIIPKLSTDSKGFASGYSYGRIYEFNNNELICHSNFGWGERYKSIVSKLFLIYSEAFSLLGHDNFDNIYKNIKDFRDGNKNNEDGRYLDRLFNLCASMSANLFFLMSACNRFEEMISKYYTVFEQIKNDPLKIMQSYQKYIPTKPIILKENISDINIDDII